MTTYDRASSRALTPSRRDFLSLGVGIFVVAAAPGLVTRRRHLVSRTLPVMGTLAEIAVVHSDRRYAYGAIDAALREVEWVDRTMSRFRPDSDLGRANAGAARAPVNVTPETAEVIAEALSWAERTQGRFDPCLGRAAAVWNVGSRTRPPPRTLLTRFAGARLYTYLELDRSAGAQRVLFRSPDVGLDLGGIAKGYAVDRAVARLRDWGIRDGLVSIGGDLFALGNRADGDPWNVGVRSPEAADRLATTLHVSDRAVATSGDYERFFMHRGRRYHHILDPETGEPLEATRRSVTVAASTCMIADAAATVAFATSPATWLAIVSNAGGDVEVLHTA